MRYEIKDTDLWYGNIEVCCKAMSRMIFGGNIYPYLDSKGAKILLRNDTFEGVRLNYCPNCGKPCRVENLNLKK